MGLAMARSNPGASADPQGNHGLSRRAGLRPRQRTDARRDADTPGRPLAATGARCYPGRVVTPQEVYERLKRVPYPGFSRDIVSFGLVRDVEVSSDGVVVTLAPSTAREEVIAQLAEVGSAIRQEGALCGVHCCGNTVQRRISRRP